uniref:E3 ubiquitin-protein ligase RNF12-like protein n=1 Tax=Anticarsia gemmatalis multiple nucleopolyhedrovirus TaxID=268591 RepID=A0A0S3IZN5_9ABAC|nr:E3 ubiquitin-protein ligase RNF12-like protein [Anticarsia gemmatalis multiple nucleopolyhedrovirus]
MDSRNEALHDAETIAEQTESIQIGQNAETNTNEQNQNAQNLLTVGVAAVVGIGIGASLIYFFNQLHNRARDNRIINEATTNYRNRPWSDEDCSICFDNMLRNQDITSLNCAHRFHTNCLLSWLKNRQSCPNCRCSV